MSGQSGDLFGWTQNAGMGWEPAKLGGREFLILSTHGGVRAPDGTPIALGYHTGHWEVGLLVEAAAKTFKESGAIPFAGACTDPCDGRSQGTTGMFDSLPYRNDAATIFRRLIRSLPTRRGVLGVATCDKGLPAMMMALATMHDLPTVLVPGGCDSSFAVGRRRRAACKPSACVSRTENSRWSRLRRSAVARVDRQVAAVSFWGLRRHHKLSAKRSACRWGILPSLLPANRSGSTWPAEARGHCLRSKPADCARAIS
jgi:dihydroxyacid dehydratase/phosphogluconate dehydratase